MILEGPSGTWRWTARLGRHYRGRSISADSKAFKGPFLELRFYFLYNIRPGEE